MGSHFKSVEDAKEKAPKDTRTSVQLTDICLNRFKIEVIMVTVGNTVYNSKSSAYNQTSCSAHPLKLVSIHVLQVVQLLM